MHAQFAYRRTGVSACGQLSNIGSPPRLFGVSRFLLGALSEGWGIGRDYRDAQEVAQQEERQHGKTSLSVRLGSTTTHGPCPTDAMPLLFLALSQERSDRLIKRAVSLLDLLITDERHSIPEQTFRLIKEILTWFVTPEGAAGPPTSTRAALFIAPNPRHRVARPCSRHLSAKQAASHALAPPVWDAVRSEVPATGSAAGGHTGLP
jgi:hypothetical protein